MDSSNAFQNLTTQVDEAISQKLALSYGELNLTHFEKTYLLRTSRILIENHQRGKSLSEADFSEIPLALLNQRRRLFVSLYHHHILVVCWASFAENLFQSVIKATQSCLQDKKFLAFSKTHPSLSHLQIEITVFTTSTAIKERELRKLKSQIELGLEGVGLKKDKKRAFFKNSVPIHHGYEHEILLKRLTKKAGLTTYTGEGTSLKKHKVLQFREQLDAKGIQVRATQLLYRCNRLVFQNQVNRHNLDKTLRLCAEFMANNIKDTGELAYQYYPYTEKVVHSNADVAIIRKLASLWVLTRLAHYFKDDGYITAAKKALDYLIERFFVIDIDKKIGYIDVKGSATIGHPAFLLLAAMNLNDTKRYDNVLTYTARFLFSQEDLEKGYFYPAYLPSQSHGFERKEIYYPGEALTALTTLYEKTQDKRYLEPAIRVHDYYTDLFDRSDKRLNMTAWMSKPYAKLFIATQDKKYADFVFKMNDFVLGKQKGIEEIYPDRIGCFSPSGNTSATGVFLESLAEGFLVAKTLGDEKRIKSYSEALWLGMRFLMQSQYTQDLISNHPSTSTLLGGIRTGVYDGSVRIDNVQHSACAILNTLNYIDLKY